MLGCKAVETLCGVMGDTRSKQTQCTFLQGLHNFGNWDFSMVADWKLGFQHGSPVCIPYLEKVKVGVADTDKMKPVTVT